MLNVQEKSATQPQPINGNGNSAYPIKNEEDSELEPKFARRRPRSKVNV